MIQLLLYIDLVVYIIVHCAGGGIFSDSALAFSVNDQRKERFKPYMFPGPAATSATPASTTATTATTRAWPPPTDPLLGHLWTTSSAAAAATTSGTAITAQTDITTTIDGGERGAEDTEALLLTPEGEIN